MGCGGVGGKKMEEAKQQKSMGDVHLGPTSPKEVAAPPETFRVPVKTPSDLKGRSHPTNIQGTTTTTTTTAHKAAAVGPPHLHLVDAKDPRRSNQDSSTTSGGSHPRRTPQPSNPRQRVGPIVVGSASSRPMIVVNKQPQHPEQPQQQQQQQQRLSQNGKKKRKLTTLPKTQRPVTSSPPFPLVDSAVVKMVHDVIGLLETYGPLSFRQLECNLNQPSRSGVASVTFTLGDVLQLLVATEIVQIVDERYCILGGVPRVDTIMPSQVMGEIESAHSQWKASLERSEIMRKALLDKNASARDLLKSLLIEYPEIARDPVYMAALRNVHVDIAAAERERTKRMENTNPA